VKTIERIFDSPCGTPPSFALPLTSLFSIVAWGLESLPRAEPFFHPFAPGGLHRFVPPYLVLMSAEVRVC
jgi:hypothetical protein